MKVTYRQELRDDFVAALYFSFRLLDLILLSFVSCDSVEGTLSSALLYVHD